jgi:hypothetical protein
MQLRPINHKDMTYIAENMRAADRREIFATRAAEDIGRLVDDCMAFSAQNSAYATIACLERPIAVIGAAEVWPGVYDVWSFGTNEFKRVGFAMTKWVRKVLIPSLVKVGAHRVHCRSIEGHVEAHEWLKMLGAEPMHTLKAWGKGREDFLLFEWHIEDVLEKGLA